MAYDVFISYSLKDADVARNICQRLESSGIVCWIAPRNIEPGIPYGEAIIQGIEQSRSLLLVFSVAANNSPQVLREIERAVSKSKPLLTVRVEDQQPTASLEFFLSSHHWFDLIPDDDPNLLSALVQAVRRSLSRQSNTMVATTGMELPRSALMGELVRSKRGWFWGIGAALAVVIFLAMFVALTWNRPLQAIPAPPATDKPDPSAVDSKPKNRIGVMPRPSLAGTTWVGSESASDTNSLQFVFDNNYSVTAYDDTGKTWSGTWMLVGDSTVVIQLTQPNAVNYSGQIEGDRMSGKAGRPGASRQWNWNVQCVQQRK
ncbi:MAG: toll/interleukin-1 receptor domain-containing protein [Thermoguttaceae bacterium]|jgi:hypothetical protein